MNTLCSSEPQLFDSTDIWDHLRARRYCSACPLSSACLRLALDIAGEHTAANAHHRGPDGTWGGLLWQSGSVVSLPSLESEEVAA